MGFFIHSAKRDIRRASGRGDRKKAKQAVLISYRHHLILSIHLSIHSFIVSPRLLFYFSSILRTHALSPHTLVLILALPTYSHSAPTILDNSKPTAFAVACVLFRHLCVLIWTDLACLSLHFSSCNVVCKYKNLNHCSLFLPGTIIIIVVSLFS